MTVEFVKPAAGRRYRSVLHRADGVVVGFEGGAHNRLGCQAEVPHDPAHLIVGGRPHAARRGREIDAEARDDVMRAEMPVRAVCDRRPPVTVRASAPTPARDGGPPPRRPTPWSAHSAASAQRRPPGGHWSRAGA